MKKIILCGMATLMSSSLLADSLTVDLKSVDENGVGESKGTVELVETPRGIVFSFNVAVVGGEHGFNIHNNSNCGVEVSELKQTVPALDAGDVYTINLSNPNNKNVFPALFVNSSNFSKQTFLVDKIKSLEPLMDKAIVIRVGGEDFSFEEISQNGGNRAILCGTLDSNNIKKSTEAEKKTLDPIKAAFMDELKKAATPEVKLPEEDNANAVDQPNANEEIVEDSNLDNTTEVANPNVEQEINEGDTAVAPANTGTKSSVKQDSTATVPANTGAKSSVKQDSTATAPANTGTKSSVKQDSTATAPANTGTKSSVKQDSTATVPANTGAKSSVNENSATTNAISSSTK